jgi:hypothetical protein
MRYSVKYQPLSGEIHAGTVRHDQKINRQVFITKEDVTDDARGEFVGDAVAAVALWLLNHDDGTGPYQITGADGLADERAGIDP